MFCITVFNTFKSYDLSNRLWKLTSHLRISIGILNSNQGYFSLINSILKRIASKEQSWKQHMAFYPLCNFSIEITLVSFIGGRQRELLVTLYERKT